MVLRIEFKCKHGPPIRSSGKVSDLPIWAERNNFIFQNAGEKKSLCRYVVVNVFQTMADVLHFPRNCLDFGNRFSIGSHGDVQIVQPIKGRSQQGLFGLSHVEDMLNPGLRFRSAPAHQICPSHLQH